MTRRGRFTGPARYTPGPWRLRVDARGRVSGVGPDGRPLFSRPGDSDARGQEEFAGNLAAAQAAPDMLALLQRLGAARPGALPRREPHVPLRRLRAGRPTVLHYRTTSAGKIRTLTRAIAQARASARESGRVQDVWIVTTRGEFLAGTVDASGTFSRV